MKILDTLLGEEVDIRQVLAKMEFRAEGLEQAALEQASLFLRAGVARVQAMRRANAAKANQKLNRALIDAEVRVRLTATGAKVTEDKVDAEVTRDTKYQAFTRAVDKAEEEEEYLKIVLEAFRMRRDSLRVIQDNRAAEMTTGRIGTARTEEVADLKAALKAKYPGPKK